MYGRDQRFSEATKAALIEVVAETYSHKELSLLFRRLGVNDAAEREEGNPTKILRVDRAVDRLSVSGQQHKSDLLELVRTLIEERWEGEIPPILLDRRAGLRRLVEGLKSDGWEIINRRLVSTTSEDAPLAEEVTFLEALLQGLGWNIALTHYRQAIANFRDSEFESSNGQLRNVLEDVLARLSEQRTGGPGRDPRGSVDRLVNGKVLTSSEAQLIKGLISVSNTNGPHPGLSNADEALFRLHVTVATVRWLLAIP